MQCGVKIEQIRRLRNQYQKQIKQSTTVPILKAGPKRAQMCHVFVFFAFLGTTAWILYKEDDLKSLLGLF